MADNPRLAEFALQAQEIGLKNPDRAGWLRMILGRFDERREARTNRELKGQLNAATDPAQATEILRKMQSQSKPVGTQL